VHEIEAIENSAHRRRLSMKPGLTCIWQITGRSNITDFDEWVKLDTRYIDEWSIWGDVLILLKTIPAVVFRKGAK
jgi:lipopolysaccharide/colanic/teichoic acid biosynthesis glycosyltransferase